MAEGEKRNWQWIFLENVGGLSVYNSGRITPNSQIRYLCKDLSFRVSLLTNLIT